MKPKEEVRKRDQKAQEKVQAKIQEQMHEPFSPKNYAKQVAIDEDDSSQVDTRKRRGRKRERDDLYFSKAVNKIDEIKTKLKTAKAEGMTVRERQRLRNQISAQ